ncbi:polysaccharide deacetylase [Flavobacterium columnare]|uniref:polysaccharide deacetylase family protein n=1 Tax=Flavobacterium columnare TaxID=996 RepID=UPI000D1AD619|nr:polysaccharide deacetylase family protein [Flavobacterium columnare]MBF6652511.1 polysaccharide deacetylase [Flavobacterium columnare]MBF6655525.1 polysaccharide deacetylase [Flavobacterium columnare]MBF6658380.1 polysaccharide deacetylase [Flavobacterium columnare]MEB3802203.1 polysaccharide deacetylase family protein [Flavobacterium columnare]PTD14820.1 polysaccharide deacetylase [Flavobacterium columnare]
MGDGKFVISLDFELHWGAAERWDMKLKKEYFDTTRRSIPFVLSLFEKYNIHATWATVGFLFAKNKKQLLDFCPKERPTYRNNKLSYYKIIDSNEVGNDENEDPYHFAPSLIELILKTPNQEIGTHTFAHYYCNESGQTKKQFNADLKAAQAIAKENFGIELKSLVFPRNQFNFEYIEVAKKNGIKVVRSNPDVWFWKSKSKLAPLARAFDTLMPISRTLTFKRKKSHGDEVLMLPASRFFRPFTCKEKNIQFVKMNRIKKEMTFAAKNNSVYHLWWHPHNFGESLEENLFYLEIILRHYQGLNEKYGFSSVSMLEMSN